MILLFDQGTMHGVLTIFAEILHCNCILTKENFGEFQTLVMHTMQGIEIDEDVLQPHSMMKTRYKSPRIYQVY